MPSKLDQSGRVAERLLRELQRETPDESADILETHISWVVLHGPYAYKIKKTVDLGFLDYSTLEKRCEFCDKELRLNKRLSPSIYIDTISIGGDVEYPRLGDEPLLEKALALTARHGRDAVLRHYLQSWIILMPRPC